jgi:hypothetical protein
MALAVILFVFHRMSTLEDRFFSVPLRIENQGNMTPATSYPRMVRITLRGEPNSIYPILEDDIDAYVNFNKYDSPGYYRFPIEVRKKGTALGIEPLEIRVDPMEISLSLDQKISKFVPLHPKLRGDVEPGYILDSYTLNPTQVVVDGPVELVSAIQELSTDFIDIHGRTGDFTVMVNIQNQDPLILLRGNGLTEFHGVISRLNPNRRISGPIAVKGLDPMFSVEMEIKTAAVTLEAKNQEELDLFTVPEDFITVDCSGITGPGTYILPLRVLVPPVLFLTATEPRELTLYIRQAEE